LYKPADELLAVRIKDLLNENGIEAMLRSYQMAWLDGLARMMRPEWGEVIVEEEDLPKARELLDGLLATLDAPEPETPVGGPEGVPPPAAD
jgi:hypothetical protein